MSVFVWTVVVPGSKHSLVKNKSCVTHFCCVFEADACWVHFTSLIIHFLRADRSRMSLTVKAYLLGKDEAVKEVRRFAVDQDVSSNFEHLCRKTAEIFSNLKSSAFSMFYKGGKPQSHLF